MCAAGPQMVTVAVVADVSHASTLSGQELARALRRPQLERDLAGLLPGAGPDARYEAADAFMWWLAAQRGTFASWQAAWNDWAAGGVVQVRARMCLTCRGRRFDVRAAARTGQPACRECGGTNRGSLLVLAARPAVLPAPDQAAGRDG